MGYTLNLMCAIILQNEEISVTEIFFANCETL